jgi:hypothetical protein
MLPPIPANSECGLLPTLAAWSSKILQHIMKAG